MGKFLTDKELAASPECYSSSKIQKMRKKSLDKSTQRQKKATGTKASVDVPYFHSKNEMLDTSLNAGKRDTPFRDNSPGFESCNRSPYQPSKRSVSFKKSKKSQNPTTPFRDFKYSSNKQNFDYQ